MACSTGPAGHTGPPGARRLVSSGRSRRCADGTSSALPASARASGCRRRPCIGCCSDKDSVGCRGWTDRPGRSSGVTNAAGLESSCTSTSRSSVGSHREADGARTGAAVMATTVTQAWATPSSTPPSTITHDWPMQRSTSTNGRTPARRSCGARSPGSPGTASPVEAVLTDNGPGYRSFPFRDALTGIEHLFTRPFRPQTNGKVERFNRTLLEEWAYVRSYRSEAQRTRALDRWLHLYNHHRCHTALGGQPPISRINNLSGHYT